MKSAIAAALAIYLALAIVPILAQAGEGGAQRDAGKVIVTPEGVRETVAPAGLMGEGGAGEGGA